MVSACIRNYTASRQHDGVRADHLGASLVANRRLSWGRVEVPLGA